LSTKASRPAKRISWVYATLSVNIALGPIGTFVQLYLLKLYGPQTGTVYVVLAVAAFNAVSIPAALIWGLATDRLHKRKILIVSSYLLTAVLLFSFLFTKTATGIITAYSLLSFVSSATATPLNLLIMETEPKNKWATGFAKLSLVSSIGAMLGYILSSFWAQYLPEQWLVIPLGILSLVSAVMAISLVPEPPFVFERELIGMHKTLSQRLASYPLVFLKSPNLDDFRRVFKGLRNELTNYVPMLYISLILFYLGSGMFNTALVPSLTSPSHLLSGSDVYAINVVAMVAQILAFRYAGKYITAEKSLAMIATQSVALRGVCYALMGIAFVVFPGVLFLFPSLVLYTIAAGICYGIYYTTSNTMVFNSIVGRNHGSTLGVYSALVGIATTAGALLSAPTSLYLGFDITFLFAGGMLGLSALITLRLARNQGQGTGT
jgi:MFS family permease